MILYLFRHGIAEDSKEAYPDDLRPLTGKGVKKTHNAARGMRAIGCRPKRIVSSPLVRARQTAEIARDVLAKKIGVEDSALLSHHTEPFQMVKWLARQPEADLLLVGHMPHLSRLAALLTSGQEGIWLELRKAGACAIEFESSPVPASGSLLWLMEPEQLADLG